MRVPWTARRSNQSILKEIVIRTVAEVEAAILWPPDVKSQLIRKDPGAGKARRLKRATDVQMVGCHH